MTTDELIAHYDDATSIPHWVLDHAIPKAIDAVYAVRDGHGPTDATMHDAGAAAAIAALIAAYDRLTEDVQEAAMAAGCDECEARRETAEDECQRLREAIVDALADLTPGIAPHSGLAAALDDQR